MVSAPYFIKQTDRYAVVIRLKPARIRGSAQVASSWNNWIARFRARAGQ